MSFTALNSPVLHVIWILAGWLWLAALCRREQPLFGACFPAPGASVIALGSPDCPKNPISPVIARNGLFPCFSPIRCLYPFFYGKTQIEASGRVWGDFLRWFDVSNRQKLPDLSNFRSFLCRRDLILPIFGDLTPSRCCYTCFDAPARIWAGFARLGAFLTGRLWRMLDAIVKSPTAWPVEPPVPARGVVVILGGHLSGSHPRNNAMHSADTANATVTRSHGGLPRRCGGYLEKRQWGSISTLVEQWGQPEAPSPRTGV